jgi:hypothetical protein
MSERHQQDNEEVKQSQIKFGEPYENTRKHSKFDFDKDLVVVPVEIEIDSMLYNLIQSDILAHIAVTDDLPFQEWVNICFRERMEQIITDPKDWGISFLA